MYISIYIYIRVQKPPHLHVVCAHTDSWAYCTEATHKERAWGFPCDTGPRISGFALPRAAFKAFEPETARKGRTSPWTKGLTSLLLSSSMLGKLNATQTNCKCSFFIRRKDPPKLFGVRYPAAMLVLALCFVLHQVNARLAADVAFEAEAFRFKTVVFRVT